MLTKQQLVKCRLLVCSVSPSGSGHSSTTCRQRKSIHHAFPLVLNIYERRKRHEPGLTPTWHGPAGPWQNRHRVALLSSQRQPLQPRFPSPASRRILRCYLHWEIAPKPVEGLGQLPPVPEGHVEAVQPVRRWHGWLFLGQLAALSLRLCCQNRVVSALRRRLWARRAQLP